MSDIAAAEGEVVMNSGVRVGLIAAVLLALVVLAAAVVWVQRQGEGAIDQAVRTPQGSEAPGAAEGGASPAAAASPTAAAGRQPVPVRRGPIADQLNLSGRVAATDEVNLGFGIAGRVETVAVKPGDTVQEGQLLIEAESKEIQTELSAARSRLELGALRQEQAQQQAQARQREGERRGVAEAARKEQSLREAESGLRRAQENYAQVRAGASPSERRAAETAVASAQAGYESAVREYQRAFEGPGDIEMRLAEQQIASARLQLAKAEAEVQKLASGPDPNDLRAAEREMLSAQNTYARAVAAIEKLSQPDPVAVSAAQREVERAELSLRAARATKTDDRSSRLQKEIAVRTAESNLQSARDRLEQLRRGAPPSDIESARRDLISARQGVEAARERLEVVRRGPDPLVIEQAKAGLESARLAVDQAERRAAELAGGPPEDVVARLAATVRQAQGSLESARAALAEVNAKPSRAELREAEDRLASAQQALERLQADLQAESGEPFDASAYDREVLERSLAQDRSTVDALERQLAQGRLRAPFAATVSSIKVRSGDPFEAETAVMTLARPGDPVLRADVTERDAGRVAPGQRAVVRLEGVDGGEFDASVDAILEGESGIGRTVQLTAIWPEPAPLIGTAVQIVLTLREKENVLLIPQRAIRSVGERRFVEVVAGQNRTLTNVEIGIVSNGQAEVVSGLREGQVVMVNP